MSEAKKSNNSSARSRSASSGRRASSGRSRSGSSRTGNNAAKRSSRSSAAKEKNIVQISDKNREIQALILIAVGVFFALAIQFTITGIVGRALGGFFKGLFGLTAFLLPYYLIVYGVLLFLNKVKSLRAVSVIFMCVLFLSLTVINAVRFIDPSGPILPVLGFKNLFNSGIDLSSGGIIGNTIGACLCKIIGKVGACLVSVLLILISVIMIANKPFMEFFKRDISDEERERRAAYKREKKERRQQIKEEHRIRRSMMHPDEVDARDARRRARYDETSRRAYGEVNEVQAFDESRLYRTPSSTIKALKKEKLDDNQRNIMNLMTDDSLFSGITAGGEGMRDEQSDKVISSMKGIPSTDETGTTRFDLEHGFVHDDEEWPEPDADVAAIDWGEKLSSEYGMDDDDLMTMEERFEKQKEDLFGKSVTPESAVEKAKDPVQKPVEKLSRTEARNATLDSSELNLKKTSVDYKFPPVNILQKGKKGDKNLNSTRERVQKLESTLRSFNVDAQVVDVTIGPAVTRYEIHPGPGVKVSKIVSLADDIALNLEARSIRIEAPIPGKAAVGIEIENDSINMVTLREIIESTEFTQSKSKISMALGKDIAGNAIVADLAKMPHLLIAGSTGSGKSVCINSIIASILYKARPDEVKFVLVDPKVVELGNYNGIPHLLIPVVTDPKKAAAALNWAVAEMDRRYDMFAATGTRKLSSYNDYLRKHSPEEPTLPEIVIIIDELADLMMTASSQVEDSICRLAQKARAAGMHLIVATQRPSVDVITGLIKANIPARIAFAVSSSIDSRTILDGAGAEKLVGNGDMLFSPAGKSKRRVQGSFISDEEVADIIEYVSNQSEGAEYSDNVIKQIEEPAEPEPAAKDDTDELFEDAVETVVRAGQASVSMLQRRFRIGYNRAARIVDLMEERGIVGPQDGSRPRQVIMTEEEFERMKYGKNNDSQTANGGNDSHEDIL